MIRRPPISTLTDTLFPYTTLFRSNIVSIQKVRRNSNDFRCHSSYNPDMARKRENVTVVGPDWFLVDWMRSLHVTQAKLGRETGWSKATVNDIFHGKTS